jgi:CHAT domain-containing protein
MFRSIIFLIILYCLAYSCAERNRAFNLKDNLYIEGIHQNEALWRADSLIFYSKEKEAFQLLKSVSKFETEIQELYAKSMILRLLAKEAQTDRELCEQLYHTLKELNHHFAQMAVAEYLYHCEPNNTQLKTYIFNIQTPGLTLKQLIDLQILKGLYYRFIEFREDSTWIHFTEAEKSLQHFPDITRQHFDTYLNLAEISTYRRKVLSGIRYANELCRFENYQFDPDSNIMAMAYNTRAFLLWREGDSKGAIEDSYLAMDYAPPDSNPRQYQTALKNQLLIGLYTAESNLWQEVWPKILHHYEENGLDYINIPRWSALIHFEKNEFALALEDFLEAYRYMSMEKYFNLPLHSTLLHYQSYCYINLKNYDKALDCIYQNQGLNGKFNHEIFVNAVLASSSYSFVSTLSIAQIYFDKYQHENKTDALEQSFFFLQLIDSLMYNQINAQNDHTILNFYLETGEQYFRLGLRVTETLWQNTLDSIYLNHYLQYSEKSKNRLMYRDMMAMTKSSAVGAAHQQRERKLKILIKQALIQGIRGNKNFDDAVAAYDYLEEEMLKNQAESAGKKLIQDLLNIREIQKIMSNKDESLLSVQEIDNALYFLLINRNKVFLEKTQLEPEIISETEAILHQLIETNENVTSIAIGTKLIPENILSALMDTVYFVPDGVFYRLPFQLLLNAQHTVYYTPSFQIMANPSNLEITKRGRMAVFAFSDMETVRALTRTKLRELPGTYKEALALKKIHPDAKLFTGRNATLENFLKVYQDPHYTHVHLALHGVASSSEKDMVKLYFRTKDFGLDSLYGYELLNYRSSNRTVTLSACQSGIGALIKGEGSYSLPRYFIINGASEVRASLWDLEDKDISNSTMVHYKL